MRLIYSIGIYLYGLGILLASLFHRKARLWISGRKNYFKKLKVEDGAPIVWFHAASLGEFEQGRPLIEQLKMYFPSHKVVLTFFSPSGYEVRKQYSGADYIFYLPLDTLSNARRFIRKIHPQMVFFIKYEFWFHYLQELKNQSIPTYLFSAHFRPDQFFFKVYGRWFVNQLNCYTHIFVQDISSQLLLGEKGIQQVSVFGDTRFDRVAKIALETQAFPILETFKADRKLILLGSTWPKDEEMVSKYIITAGDDVCFVIAPHDIQKSHIEYIQALFPFPSLLYSQIKEEKFLPSKLLIVDCMGILSGLYRYANIAYIGGGFGKGIHNILESLTFGIPTVFGPNYHKFQEAVEIQKRGGGVVVANREEFVSLMNTWLQDNDTITAISQVCRDYVYENQGATKRILEFLTQNNGECN